MKSISYISLKEFGPMSKHFKPFSIRYAYSCFLLVISISCTPQQKKRAIKEVTKPSHTPSSPELTLTYLEEKKEQSLHMWSSFRKYDVTAYGNPNLKVKDLPDFDDAGGVLVAKPDFDFIQTTSPGKVDKTKPIFAEEPDITQVNQSCSYTGLGALSCPFLSALSTTIKIDRAIIKRMIFDDLESGNVVVSLWDWKSRQYLKYVMKKERDLSTFADPTKLGAPRYTYTQQGKLWTHLFERAMDAHLKKLNEGSIPKTAAEAAIIPSSALRSILGEQYTILETYNSRQAFTVEQLGFVMGGIISNPKLPQNFLPPLKEGHSYGIVGVRKDPPGFLLYDSLDPGTASSPVFLPFANFSKFPNARLILMKGDIE